MRQRWIAFFGAFALVACEGTVEIGRGASADSHDAGPSQVLSDAGGSPDAAADDAQARDDQTSPALDSTSTSPASDKRASLLLRHSTNAGSGAQLSPFMAYTFASEGSPDPAKCGETVVGACSVRPQSVCTDIPGTETSVTAPTSLTFAGAEFPSNMTLASIVPGGPPTLGSTTPWWTTGGESVGVALAATADTPDFSVTLTTPAPAQYTVPTAAAPNSPVTLSWTGGAVGGVDVMFVLNQTDGNGNGTGPYAFCSAPSNVGSLVVPASVLAMLGSGALEVRPYSVSKATAVASGWDFSATLMETTDEVRHLSVP
jgi:hypothetical protein